MIRTVQISPYVLAQGDRTPCPWMSENGFCLSPRCMCRPGYATVRTGPTTTATGRLIERKRDE